jgi:sensor histidine kinase YesM
MTQIFIQQAQTVAGNVAIIVILLMVSAIIGYLTAWYYSKSIHLPIIRGLEAEKEGLIKKVAGLKDDKKKLEIKVEKLNENIALLEKQLEEKNKEIRHTKKPVKE